MIFASFGNSPRPFVRLAKAIEMLAEHINEEVIVQNGYTEYPFKHCTAIQFLSQTDYISYLKKCSIAVLQGGWGGISEASDLGCKIVAVPRMKGIEHYHDQVQLIRALEKEGICLGCYDTDALIEIVDKARNYLFRPIARGNASKIINDFISLL